MTKAKSAARPLSLVASIPAPAQAAPAQAAPAQAAPAQAAPAQAAPAKPEYNFTGKNAAARQEAFASIAPLSFAETSNRMLTIANLKTALGSKPSNDLLRVTANEWVIGRVAARLFAFDNAPRDAHLSTARDIVLHYAMPSMAAKAPKLKAGQLGRRTDTQHKAVRAANEAWSKILAETGHGAAMTQAVADKKKRATNANPVRGEGKGAAGKGATPAHTALVQAPAPMSADEACEFLLSQAATLQAFANKHAKIIPSAFGAAVMAFRSAALAAANERALDKAKVEAEQAERAK